MERLQKVLAQAGVASRRKSEELIQQGHVTVNGIVVTELGTRVNPETDDIKVQGQPIHTESLVYYLFHKPVGYITSVRDPHGRPVVMQFFDQVKERIYPVGRLDKDTSGLLLFTNDGSWANRLLHPSYEIEKVYRATVQGIPSEEQVEQLRRGILLTDGLTAPAKVEWVEQSPRKDQAVLQLTIHEGRNRQVRRMFRAIGHTVLQLHRERFGFLTLHGLATGEYRALEPEEVTKLATISSHNVHN